MTPEAIVSTRTTPTFVAKPLTPPLKWAGGKRYLVPTLQTLWIEGRRLVEPFVGGASVALGLQPATALLNDVNPHLINFYAQIKANGLPIDIPMKGGRETYDAYRAIFNHHAVGDHQGTLCAAQLFYYLNRTGFNGVCRFNAKGVFNVPWGQRKTINYRKEFHDLQEAFRHWQFTSVDFEQLEIEANDFIYADPPYDTPFTTFSVGGFSWADQERVAAWLARQSVPVVASNMATKRIVALYEGHGFDIRYVSAPRRISCNGDREKAREILATRNLH